MKSEWPGVALAVVNMLQVVMLGWLNARQSQLHHRINGGIDRWEEGRLPAPRKGRRPPAERSDG